MTTEISSELQTRFSNLRIALVHDYLVQDGGAERVFSAFQRIFPHADLHVLIHNPKRSHPDFASHSIHTSFLNRWPLSKRFYQWYLPFLPVAVEHLDLRHYDLILSSSSSFAKGLIAPPGALHVCYLHTPTRFLWEDRIGYLTDLPYPKIIRSALPTLLHRLRIWDRVAADRPDVMLTNSNTSRARIQRYYQRDPEVLFPPVDTDRIPLSRHEGSYWLAGGRLVPYKRFDLIVRAFAKLNLPLKIFGVGPEWKRLKRIAGKQTEFLGFVTDEEKARLYRYSIGYLHPQMEDFGITAVEAMSAGKPVIAYGRGGGAETVIPGTTGIFLEKQTWQDIGDAVIRHRPQDYHSDVIRSHAERFSFQRFSASLLQILSRVLSDKLV